MGSEDPPTYHMVYWETIFGLVWLQKSKIQPIVWEYNRQRSPNRIPDLSSLQISHVVENIGALRQGWGHSRKKKVSAGLFNHLRCLLQKSPGERFDFETVEIGKLQFSKLYFCCFVFEINAYFVSTKNEVLPYFLLDCH